MRVVEQKLLKSLSRAVKNQQALLELVCHEHLEVIGRANVESILEATRISIDDVDQCLKDFELPEPAFQLKERISLKKEQNNG